MKGQFVVSVVSLLCIKGKGKTEGRTHMQTQMMGENSVCSTAYTLPYNLLLFLDLFRRVLLESPLTWKNYSEKFQLLLYLEEQQMEVDIKRYNIPNNDRAEATMTRDRDKKLLVLEVSMCSNYRKSKKTSAL